MSRRGAFATLLTGLMTGLLAAARAARAAAPGGAPTDPTEVLDLWPGGPPGGVPAAALQASLERGDPAGLRDRAIIHVNRPTLTVFRPERPNGAAVILAPGGGYERVVVDKEGFETARWLAARGYVALVLLYRLPGDGWAGGADAPLQDAQRAVRLTRARAVDLGVDPARIAFMGFSAGGHVAASLATRFDAAVYPPTDPADALSARPDLAALIYPVVSLADGPAHAGSRRQLLGEHPDPARRAAYSPELQVTPRAPPTFLLHAADDKTVPVANSLLMFAALRAQAVAAELHVFEEGGHGFGLRAIAGKPVAAWPSLFEAFARRKGL